MPLERTGYRLSFEELCPGQPALGSVAVVPWDSDIFGFPVAVYRIGAERLDATAGKEFTEQFHRWARQSRVCLCACMVPADEPHYPWKSYLAEAGFHFVDFSMQATLNRLQSAHLPKGRSELRVALPDDREEVVAIAIEAFRHGRYHADPLFPRELADKRYGHWVRNAFADGHLFVMGGTGSVQGFLNVTQEEGACEIRLAAISPALRGTVLGFELYVSVLHLLKGMGGERVVSSISAVNTPVMNVHAMLGFSFSGPEMVFHWHKPRTVAEG